LQLQGLLAAVTMVSLVNQLSADVFTEAASITIPYTVPVAQFIADNATFFKLLDSTVNIKYDLFHTLQQSSIIVNFWSFFKSQCFVFIHTIK
jgi:hypothetical protein